MEFRATSKAKKAATAPAQRVTELAVMPMVHQAFQWLHINELRLRQWQMEAVRIPAPPFGEAERAAWMRDTFATLGLENAHIDGEGNALAELKGEDDSRCVLLSAHIDTVFPAGTDCSPREEDARQAIGGVAKIFAPGICDNGAGMAAMLGLAAALKVVGYRPRHTIIFAGNVGEEAEGNLRGMRAIFQSAEYGLRSDGHRSNHRIRAVVALDGSGCGPVVTHGLGSRRLRIAINGPGGHSWSDAGTANPIVVLSHALSAIARLPLPEEPRTTLNIGTVSGGTAVNAIPQEATAQVDLRSTSAEELLRLEVMVHRAVEDAVLEANGHAAAKGKNLRQTITVIGSRPEAALPEDARILQSLRAVDRHLGIRTSLRIGSTDANIPLALGVEAVSIGAGGTSGGIHTRQEWYSPAGRELALRRALLLLMDLANGGD